MSYEENNLLQQQIERVNRKIDTSINQTIDNLTQKVSDVKNELLMMTTRLVVAETKLSMLREEHNRVAEYTLQLLFFIFALAAFCALMFFKH